MKDGRHLTLGIESSCDETAIAVLADGRDILSNTISSQIEIHKEYGGVVPEIASRHHLKNIPFVLTQSLEEAGCTIEDINEIGVTAGPGLAGALLMGTAFAKAVAMAANKPLVGVHHIQAHIFANLIEHPELKPPFLSLVCSGGHTHLIEVRGYNEFKILGATRDDAVGEAYDKVARVIGLGYPGGPKIDRVAKDGDPEAISFPRGRGNGEFDFSFSGLKSAVLNYLNSCEMKGEEISVPDVAASFQKAVIDVLSANAAKALDSFGDKRFAIAGGVASNSLFRSMVEEECAKRGVAFYKPSPVLCTDNGAMIASAGYYKYIKGEFSDLSLNGVADLELCPG